MAVVKVLNRPIASELDDGYDTLCPITDLVVCLTELGHLDQPTDATRKPEATRLGRQPSWASAVSAGMHKPATRRLREKVDLGDSPLGVLVSPTKGGSRMAGNRTNPLVGMDMACGGLGDPVDVNVC